MKKNILYYAILIVTLLTSIGGAMAYSLQELRFYYSMDNGTTSSTFLNDISGNNKNATSRVNIILNTTGFLNDSTTYNGTTNSYANISNYNPGYSSKKFSVSAWIKANNVTKDQNIIYEYGGGFDWVIDTSSSAPNKFRFCVWRETSGVVCSLSGLVYTNIWYHIVGTYDISTHNMTLYLNGSKIDEDYNVDTDPAGTGNGNLGIGASPSGTGLFNGSIDELSFFNNTLNTNDVALIYSYYLNKTRFTNYYTLFYAKDLDIKNATINRFNVTLNSSANNYFFSTTNGLINQTPDYTQIYNITFDGQYGIDSATYYDVNLSIVNNFTAYLNESKAYVNFSAREIFTDVFGINISVPFNMTAKEIYNDAGSNNYTINSSIGWSVLGLPILNMSNGNTHTYYITYMTNYTFMQDSGISPNCTNQSFTFSSNTTHYCSVYDTNLTIRAYNNTIQLTNWNLTLAYSGILKNNDSYTVTSQNLSLRLLKRLNYTYYFSSSGLSSQSGSILGNSLSYGLMNYSINTFLPGTLNITIVDENTGIIITQNMTVIITSTNYSNTNYTMTGNFIITIGEDNIYKIRIYNENYTERDYFVTISGMNTVNLIARLSQDNDIYNFYVKNINKNALQDSTISVQRMYGGSYVTVAQCQSNLIGLCSLNLITNQEYRFNIAKTGFDTLTTIYVMVAELNNTAIYLSSTTSDPYTYYYNNITYTIDPNGNLIMLNGTTLVSFSITTSSQNGNILWTATQYGNSIVNITGSPSGGTANLTLNFENVSTSAFFDINYSFQDVYSNYPIVLKYHYYVYNGSFYPSTLTSAVDAFGGDFSAPWKAIVATFIMIITGLLMNSLFGIPGISVISSLGVAIFFAAISWLSIVYVSIMVIIIVVTYFIAGRAS